MLELIGRRYVIDHCVLHLRKMSEDEACRVYVTDALKAIADNTGKLVKEGVGMSKRFVDFINADNDEPSEDAEQKAEEIKSHIGDILDKLGNGGG